MGKNEVFNIIDSWAAEIPEEYGKAIIASAAQKTGKQAETLTTRSAIYYLLLDALDNKPELTNESGDIKIRDLLQETGTIILNELRKHQADRKEKILEQFVTAMPALVLYLSQDPQADPAQLLASVPADAANAIIHSAAKMRNQPEEDITLEDAINILQHAELSPTERETVNIISDEFVSGLESRLKAITPAPKESGQLFSAALFTASESLRNGLDELIHAAPQAMATVETVVTFAREALRKVSDFVNSEQYKAIRESVSAVKSFIEQNSDILASLSNVAQEVKDLAPYLAIELKELQKDPAFANYTLQDFFEDGFDEDGNPIEDSPLAQAIAWAKQRKKDFEETEDAINFTERAADELPQIIEAAEQKQPDLPRIISRTTDLLHYPLDKPNSVIWNMLAGADPNGQLKMQLRTSKKGSPLDALVLYGISFEELEAGVKITRQLTPFDKRVYIAAAALFNGGNDIISATQIYKMMGNKGQPKAEQIQKINDSLTKMGAAHVFLDSTAEVEINKKYNAFRYDSSLLPFERISAYINNTLTESAIHLFREPPLITFARQRGQITGLTRQLLESPISKTDANLQLEDYLLERIGHMKNPKGKAPHKMLFATIYEHCNITGKTEKDRKERQRTPEKIRKYLDHYKKCGWIAGYKMDKDGVTIII